MKSGPEDHRSYLFVPGDRPSLFAKAAQSDAGRIVLDLEDAVSADKKGEARDLVARWFANGGRGLVRINGADTKWFDDDVAFVRSCSLDGFVISKAAAANVAVLERAVSNDVRAIALIETVAGVMELQAVASSPLVSRLAFGSVDFALDSGISGTGEEVNHVRSALVMASRYAGLPGPVDGVCTMLDDPKPLARDIERARRFGFCAKLAIHPRQIAAINRGFQPTETEIAWARDILDAAVVAEAGVTALRGEMIDRPVIERARRILTQAGK
jgi:citrate lyase subunit beta / citryl-CoA lyase